MKAGALILRSIEAKASQRKPKRQKKLFLLAVSFSGFALSARLRKPSAEDLDNCTLENEFFLKASHNGNESNRKDDMVSG